MRSFRGAPPGTSLTVTIAITILLIGVVQYLLPEPTARPDAPPATCSATGQVSIVRRQHPLGRGRSSSWWPSPWRSACATSSGSPALGVAMRAVVDNPDLAGLTGAPPLTIARASWMLGVDARRARRRPLLPHRRQARRRQPHLLRARGLRRRRVRPPARACRSPSPAPSSSGLVQGYAPIGFPDHRALDPPPGGRARASSSSSSLLVAARGQAQPSDASSVATRPRVPSLPATPGARRHLHPGRRPRSPTWPATTCSTSPSPSSTARSCSRSCCSPATPARSRSPSTCSSASAPSPWARSPAATACSAWPPPPPSPCPLGVITALPAMRLQGLYLALVTFALAQVSRDVIFQDTRDLRRWAASPSAASRCFGIDFSGDRAFAAAVRHRVRARRHRRARAPTRVRSGGDWPPCATARPPAPPSAWTCAAPSSPCSCSRRPSPGWPGRSTAGSASRAGQLEFEPLLNILLFLFAFVGGITTITGALLGGLLFAAAAPGAVRGPGVSPGSCSPSSP